MLREGGALRGHSGAVLRCQNGSESFHKHTAMDIRAGTGENDSDSWYQVWDFQFWLVFLACAGLDMHPSSGDRGEKTNEHLRRP